MNNATTNEVYRPLPKFIPFFIFLDGFTALLVGILNLFSVGMTDYFELDATVGAMMRQQAKIILLIVFVYQITCIVALFYWRQKKSRWKILMAGLAAFHFVGIILLKFMSDDPPMACILTPSVFISAIINFIVIFFIYRENARGSLIPR
jgi:cbb3-type cytochrome oxidase subunit 3